MEGSELGCCCPTVWTQTLNWFTAPQHWLYARIMLYCGTNEILIYRAPAILPQKMSVIGKKWQCSVHQDWLIMMSDVDKEFFCSYLNIGESPLPWSEFASFLWIQHLKVWYLVWQGAGCGIGIISPPRQIRTNNAPGVASADIALFTPRAAHAN